MRYVAWTQTAVLCAAAAAATAACGDDGGSGTIDAPGADADVDAMTDAAIDGGFVAPTMLSETGLYSNIGTKTVASDVHEFVPRWQLWSDSAVKRRWIYLPPGSKIDTSNMDFWTFPTGTKMWKEFERGGRRIETRLLQKTGDDDFNASWYMVSFQWDQGETDAMAVPSGYNDENGVNDIPDRSKCRVCHQSSRNPSVILGFQALQLDYNPTEQNLVDLDYLVQQDLLTVEPTGGSATTAYFPLPAESGTPVIEPAVGYLHGNCGGCHNARSEVAMNTVPVEFRLLTAESARASWAATQTYIKAVNIPATLGSAGSHIVRGGDTAQSAVHTRMDIDTGAIAMPPSNTRETRDTAAITVVDAWINSLPAPN
jgi:hypothetical protein